MNTSDENTRTAKIDEYGDRLIDNGLTELLGNEPPPDLSERVLTAAAVSLPQPADQGELSRPSARRWLAVAIAASLLVGGTFIMRPNLIRPSGIAVKEAAKMNSVRNERLGQIRDEFSTPGLQWSNVELPPANDTPVSGEQQLAAGVKMDRYSETETAAQPASPSSVDSRFNDQIGLDGLIRDGQVTTWAESAPTDGVYFETAPEQSVALGVEGGYGRGGTERLYAFEDVDRMAGVALGRGYGGESVKETAEGSGPGSPGDQYSRIVENPFIKAEGANAVSTFSIDVDTASYANVRQFLMDMNALPPPDAVRIEELVNYFDYDYAGPPPNATDAIDTADAAETPTAPGSDGGSNDAAASNNHPAPFAAHVEVAGCPWKTEHRLVRIGIKGRELDRDKRPRSNLVFLVDVSGSMDEPNKLPLVVYGLERLTRQLGENDRVAIVVYANSEGLVLPSTVGSDQRTILAALGQLQAGGSTAGGAGIQLAYQIAEDNFVKGGTNRVILCTDGDFNVGVTSTAELERMCEQKAKDTGVFLSVLGFGRGNLNDAMMEAIADHGNGNYHYIDNRTESRRVLVEEMTGTLVTIAKDVKIQVEFNTRQVAGYRLIGYENRMLRTEDFNDDTKDAGEIGAGHTVTALYEIVPAGQKVDVPAVDELKYQSTASKDLKSNPSASGGDVASELLTLKMRYKQPDGDTSRKQDWAITDEGQAFRAASGDFQFAAAVAGFGLLLRDSQHKGNLTFAAVVELAQSGLGKDEHGYRAEFLEIVRRAAALRGE